MYAVEYKKSFRPKIKNPARYSAVGVYGAENESKYNLIGPRPNMEECHAVLKFCQKLVIGLFGAYVAYVA